MTKTSFDRQMIEGQAKNYSNWTLSARLYLNHRFMELSSNGLR